MRCIDRNTHIILSKDTLPETPPSLVKAWGYQAGPQILQFRATGGRWGHLTGLPSGTNRGF
jgi:hypothetical protein